MRPSVDQFQQALVKHGIVDPCAVEDPEGFDNYRTLALIGYLWRELFQTECPRCGSTTDMPFHTCNKTQRTSFRYFVEWGHGEYRRGFDTKEDASDFIQKKLAKIERRGEP